MLLKSKGVPRGCVEVAALGWTLVLSLLSLGRVELAARDLSAALVWKKSSEKDT